MSEHPRPGRDGARSSAGGDPGCRRTAGLIDRIVTDVVTAGDREHAVTCPACGPVLARSVRFDDALRSAARSVVAEELPRGVLDPDLSGAVGGVRPGSAVRAFAPGLAGVAAGVIVLVLAAGVALAPGGIGGPTSPPPVASTFSASLPVFYPSAVIEAALSSLPYDCMPGGPLATAGTRPGQPVREGVVCASRKDDATKRAALITGEASDGEVVLVTIKGELVGTDTLAATEALAAGMGKLTFASIADQENAQLAGNWVDAALPQLRVLPAGDAAVNVIGELRLTLQRSPVGTYLLVLEPLDPT